MNKQDFKAFLKQQSQPMKQSMYWIIYVSCSYILALKTVEVSALASYELIKSTPQLAQYSTFMSHFF
jgi:hypothetical protein